MKSRFFAPAAVGLLLTAVILLSSFSGKYVTVMTYNVGAFGKYTKSSVKAVAKIIRASGADIVGLNETDSCNIRHNTFQVKDLAKRLGWDYSFARALRFGGGSYGNGVVSSYVGCDALGEIPENSPPVKAGTVIKAYRV